MPQCSKKILLCSTFVPIMLNFFNYAHQNIHNNSNFSMISEIQLVLINIINFILLIFLNLNKFLTENDSYLAILHSQLFFCP